MPVQKTKLKNAIVAAFKAEMEQTKDPEKSIDRIAGAISDAVAVAIVEGVNTAVIALSNTAGPVAGTITATAV